jgi:hypothetical protein
VISKVTVSPMFLENVPVDSNVGSNVGGAGFLRRRFPIDLGSVNKQIRGAPLVQRTAVVGKIKNE